MTCNKIEKRRYIYIPVAVIEILTATGSYKWWKKGQHN